MAMLSLAVTVASPLNYGALSLTARAQTPAPAAADSATNRRPFIGVVPAFLAEQPKAGDADLLRQGVDQYSRGQYEEALGTLQQVKPDTLAAEERKTFDATIRDAESAANERKAARAAFEQGQTALDKKDASEAMRQYNNVLNNKFADEGTKKKAAEQIAVAKAMGADATPGAPAIASGADAKALYRTGREQYRKGDWIAARQNLEAARANGFKPGLFEESPDSI